MTHTEIAEMFSKGEFEKTYDFITEDAIWIVVEEDSLVGKKSIIKNCRRVSTYFKSVTTKFETINMISDKNNVVINGTAEFLRENKRVSFVSAYDLYEFNDKNEIHKITSYCIQGK